MAPPEPRRDDQGNHKVFFDRLRIDTSANRTSVISVQQYHPYCQTFNEPHSIKPANNRTITGIGGISKTVGVAFIQVPLTKLSVVIVVNFLVLDHVITTFLPMKDMLENDMDIAIQGCYVRLGNRRQQLVIEK